jgi:enoyl-CoA hydratase/carnithine racemase
MNYDNLKFETKDHIAIITLNHPPVNAWNWGMMADFEKAIDAVENDPATRVLIITGGGEKAFSAGFDLSDSANSHKTSPKGRELWTRLDRFAKPVIAAINGHVLAGGMELALSCHFRIMVDDPKLNIGLTELNVGIIPGWGGTQRLTRIVGKARALDMILFSTRINPQQALEAGQGDGHHGGALLHGPGDELALGAAHHRGHVVAQEGCQAGVGGPAVGPQQRLHVIERGPQVDEGRIALSQRRRQLLQGQRQ